MPDVLLYRGDCLEEMSKIPDGSVDLVLTDPPYGTTACKWDSVIPFEPMWAQLKRVAKKNAAILLFGSEPFSSALRMSNIKQYKYDWYWDKVRGVGHLNAKVKPMNCIEMVSVFYQKTPTYNPQMRKRESPRVSKNNATQSVYGKSVEHFTGDTLQEKFPINLVRFSKSSKAELVNHPTQKPVALLEYLIRTYTNDGETVLDFTMGSGSTGVACVNTNRNFIGIELDEGYFKIAEKRIEDARTTPLERIVRN